MSDLNNVLDQVKEIKTGMEETLKAAAAAQEKASSLEEKVAGTDTTVQSAVEASAKSAEAVQELTVKLDAVEKTAEQLEKSLSRLSTTGKGTEEEAKRLEAKACDQMMAYMRTKTLMTDEIVELTAKSLVQKTLLGVPESMRETEMKTLIAGSNPDGGYWIRPERSSMMIQRIFETSPIRSIANIQTTNTDAVEFIIDDDEAASGGWVGEVQARPETGTPKIGKLTIPIHEQYAQPKATQKMLDDAGFDIESWLAGKVTRKMSRVENTAFIVGDGSQKPRGILALPAWEVNTTPTVQGIYERGALEHINSGTSAQVTADGLKLVQSSLIEDYQASAVWGMNRSTWYQVIILKDAQGQYLLDPRSMKVGDTLTLLGKRVMFMHDVPVAAADALSVVYGDFSVGYTIIDRIGFRVIRDNLTEKPNVKFYTTKRVGGDVTNYESLKVMQLSA